MGIWEVQGQETESSSLNAALTLNGRHLHPGSLEFSSLYFLLIPFE
jgi:hypothetical protein